MAPSSAGGSRAGWREENQLSSSRRTLKARSQTLGGPRRSSHVPSRDFVAVIGTWGFYTPVSAILQAGQGRQVVTLKSKLETRKPKIEIRKPSPKFKIENPKLPAPGSRTHFASRPLNSPVK
jgi:hypothetical protein